MNENQALQIINRAVQTSNDRQIRSLNYHLQKNLAEHFAHLSEYINFARYDIDDVLRTLLYCDEQRQKGMMEFMMNRGRRGASTAPRLESHINNVRRIGNGTSLAGTSDLDMVAQYAKFQFELGTQGLKDDEDKFVPEPDEIKRLRLSGEMPTAPRLGRTGEEPAQIQGDAHLDTAEPAERPRRRRRSIGDDAVDIRTESKYNMRKTLRLTESQLNRVILESAKRLIKESRMLNESGARHSQALYRELRSLFNSDESFQKVLSMSKLNKTVLIKYLSKAGYKLHFVDSRVYSPDYYIEDPTTGRMFAVVPTHSGHGFKEIDDIEELRDPVDNHIESFFNDHAPVSRGFDNFEDELDRDIEMGYF